MGGEAFRAFVADTRDGLEASGVSTLTAAELPQGEITIRVEYSGVNYKDALAVRRDGGVAAIPRLVPGIDLAGTVVDSTDSGIAAGQSVIVHGYDLGVGRHGGFAELARVPAAYVVPMPAGLDARSAMVLGTAGFTAAMSVVQLEERGLSAADGPVLVLGATGGVGAIAVNMLADRGYEVLASTGKDARDWLLGLGASEVLPRLGTGDSPAGPLEGEEWAAVVDPVGGRALASALSSLRWGGAVAQSGMVGGIGLKTTVLPFIIRGAAILGINSVDVPIDRRREIWARMGDDLKPSCLEGIIDREIGLDGLEAAMTTLLEGGARGRFLLSLGA
jgi:putative YhdH/YhfP family quinone oxidoreductase